MHLKWLTCTPIVGALAIAGCGSTDSPASSNAKPQAASPAHTSGKHMAAKNGGLASNQDGYELTLKRAPMRSGRTSTLRFEIQAPDGRPQTDYAIDQTKRLHFYLVRDDLTGYEHLHPTLGPDGTWSVQVRPQRPGPYRVYTDFVAKEPAGTKHAVVVSRPLRIAGRYRAEPLPEPAARATSDDYEVAVTGSPKAGAETPLMFTITRAGKPVSDLEPYLDTFAHMTALKERTLSYSHLHPLTKASSPGRAGPGLKFAAELPTPGRYRLFLQFKDRGSLHLAQFTVRAR
jgi:hypothetical protein